MIQYYSMRFTRSSKGKVIGESASVKTITSIALILSIPNVLSIYVNNRQIVVKMYIQGALMSKSRNIA